MTSVEKNPQQLIKQTDNGFEIYFPTLDSAVHITYTTTPTNSSGNINIGNIATGTASEIGSASDSTSIQVGSDGSIDGSTKPSESTKPNENMMVPLANDNNNSSGGGNNNSGHGLLPQTGNNKTSTMILSIVGVTIVIGIITFIVKKKR